MNLVDRFLHYVSFDTQSDELTNLTPSTPGQMLFAQKLAGVGAYRPYRGDAR